MLTRDLISVSCRQGQIKPRFVSAAAPALLELSEQLLSAYRQAAENRQSASELKEFVMPLIDGAHNRIFARALQKLLDDRSTFASAEEIDFAGCRAEILQASAALLKGAAALGSMADYHQLLSQSISSGNPLMHSGQLYADLPENDRLLAFDDLDARQLLERYNVALVQALLLNAASLEVWVSTEDAPKLRRLFKYLRFFQLLATLEDASEKTTRSTDGILDLHIIVDGPASILEQSRSYGLQLATFFPAICTVEQWRIKAEIVWKEKPFTLELDESSGLVCPYHNFAAYIPDEIRLFHRQFKETVSDWQIVGHTPFLRGSGREVIIPDLSFQRGKKVIHLELFNRWHKNGLEERLKWLEKHPKQPLILGVDRSLLKQNSELAARLESSEWFQQCGFLYRDYPTCEKTRRALEARRSKQ